MPANANKSLRAADARLSLSLPCAEQYLNLPKVGGGVYLSSILYTHKRARTRSTTTRYASDTGRNKREKKK